MGLAMEPTELRYSIFVHEGKSTFWAYCPEFDLIASGGTAEEARQTMEALIEEYLEQVQQLLNTRLVFGNNDWNVDLLLLRVLANSKDRVVN